MRPRSFDKEPNEKKFRKKEARSVECDRKKENKSERRKNGMEIAREKKESRE